MSAARPVAGPIGFGIVGAGAIAAAHVAAIEGISQTRLVAVTGGRKAPELAAEHGAKHYQDVNALVADDEVAAVAVCTPSGAHMEAAVAAARAGKHVIVEKPLEITAERAMAIIGAAHAAGVKLATIFMSRFAEGNARLKRAVDSGELGRLLQGDAYVKWWRSQEYYDSGAWRGSRELDGGGALMNQAIHQVDLLLWVMGDVSEVFAYADTLAHERIDVEDTLVAVLRFANGALGSISAATSLWPGEPKRLEVHGTSGSVVLRDDVVKRWEQRDSEVAGAEPTALAQSGTPGVGRSTETATETRGTGGFSNPMAISFDNHRRQYEDFVDAIRHNRPPAVDGAEGLKSVVLIEATYESIRTNRPVRLAMFKLP